MNYVRITQWLPLILVACAPTLALSEQKAGTQTNSSEVDAEKPRPPIGVWDVEHLAVDEQNRMHWQFVPDDPSLVGRSLFVDRAHVRFNGSRLICPQSQWTPHQVTWQRVLSSFPRPTDGGRAPLPEPLDFNLTVTPTAKIWVFPVCPRDRTKSTDFLKGTWLALLSAERLVMRDDSAAALLFLRRRPDHAPVAASFECSQAESVVEKTICSDYDVAAWDRSLSAAYRMAEERSGATSELVESQREWLAERDTCGADVACLRQKMSNRTSDLASLWSNF
jgi:uncharacterized protein YecT (DUF1311 family)